MKIFQTLLLIAFSAAVGYFIGLTRGYKGEKPKEPVANRQTVTKPQKKVTHSQNLNNQRIRTDQRWYLKNPSENRYRQPIKTEVRKPKPIKVKPNRVPFNVVIKEATKHEVLPHAFSSQVDQEVVQHIAQAADKALLKLNEPTSPIRTLRRINEASHYFEEALRMYLNEGERVACAIPLNTKGNPQRSGYPDLHITHLSSGRHYYLDPKLYEHSAERSSLRTFYYSPTSKRGKIHHDAVHFVLGISHDGNNGAWRFLDWKLVDLYHLDLKLKTEYNASNRGLYMRQSIIKHSA